MGTYNIAVSDGFIAKKYEEGVKKEDELIALLNKLNVETARASRNEDMHEHWDFKMLTKSGEWKKVDAKGIKDANSFMHYLEIKNVSGKEGWLYGLSDYIAFETDRYWIFVETQKLRDFVSKNVKKVYVLSTDDKILLYKLYTRNNRKDVLTKITGYDLCFLANKILSK
jgi:hypothetical protein